MFLWSFGHKAIQNYGWYLLPSTNKEKKLPCHVGSFQSTLCPVFGTPSHSVIDHNHSCKSLWCTCLQEGCFCSCLQCSCSFLKRCGYLIIISAMALFVWWIVQYEFWISKIYCSERKHGSDSDNSLRFAIATHILVKVITGYKPETF